MPKDSTVRKLLSIGEDEAIAILGSQREELTYGNLREQVDETVLSLNKIGIGRNDRVAIVLPNGPEMATAFVSIASGATTAPLNPAYREEEFEFYLADLQSKALLVEEGSNTSAVNAADKLNIPVLDLVVDEAGPVGRFKIMPRGDFRYSKSDLSGGLASVDDFALVLHTSGRHLLANE